MDWEKKVIVYKEMERQERDKKEKEVRKGKRQELKWRRMWKRKSKQ